MQQRSHKVTWISFVWESRQGKWERKRGGWKRIRNVHISTASTTILKIYHDLTLCVPGELIAQRHWLSNLHWLNFSWRSFTCCQFVRSKVCNVNVLAEVDHMVIDGVFDSSTLYWNWFCRRRSCKEPNENWLCLTCHEVYCGRYVNAHMLAHSTEADHPLAAGFRFVI